MAAPRPVGMRCKCSKICTCERSGDASIVRAQSSLVDPLVHDRMTRGRNDGAAMCTNRLAYHAKYRCRNARQPSPHRPWPDGRRQRAKKARDIARLRPQCGLPQSSSRRNRHRFLDRDLRACRCHWHFAQRTPNDQAGVNADLSYFNVKRAGRPAQRKSWAQHRPAAVGVVRLNNQKMTRFCAIAGLKGGAGAPETGRQA